MIAILVMSIIVLMVVSATAFTAYELHKTNAIAFKAQQLVEDLAMVKKSLLVTSNYFNTLPVLPIGKNDLNRHALPDFIIKKRNPFGMLYVYCPFSIDASGTLETSIKLDSATAYNAHIEPLEKRGVTRDYVTSSDPSPFASLGIQAFIISPTPPFSGSIRCQDVTYDADLFTFKISGGRVESITTTEIEASNL